MLTNTHILVGAALFARKKFSKRQNLAVLFGGLLPDLSVFVMVLVSRLPGFQVDNLWRKPDGLYWQEPWQTLSMISNSAPLYAAMLILGFVLAKQTSGRLKGFWLGLSLLSAACLAHVLLDFPVHADDAHIHFWPLTEARFYSPISYWDRRHFGDIVGALEAVAGLLIAFVLWRRFTSLWPRVGVVFLALPFVLSLGFSIYSFAN